MKSKQMKQQEATERNIKWNTLTNAQKIQSLQQRPGKSAKQLNNLSKGK